SGSPTDALPLPIWVSTPDGGLADGIDPTAFPPAVSPATPPFPAPRSARRRLQPRPALPPCGGIAHTLRGEHPPARPCPRDCENDRPVLSWLSPAAHSAASQPFRRSPGEVRRYCYQSSRFLPLRIACLEIREPSLHPHYRASRVLRPHPPPAGAACIPCGPNVEDRGATPSSLQQVRSEERRVGKDCTVGW